MKVVLTRKLADYMDGVDVRNVAVGDVIEVAAPEAELLLAENWAIPDRRQGTSARREPERRGVGAFDRAS